ncbi:MAG TPA: D-2-hydroxyacid dehydrogenase [Gallionellaceae bacterium]|nr:D-2-hydroxyacid dehydrogenase [Gallionellaceae bacterium]
MPGSRIVFLDRSTLPVPMRPPAVPLEWEEYAATPPDQVAVRLQNAEVAIINKVPLRAEVLKKLPRLRLIAITATGTNNVDLDHCRTRGVAVCNVRGYSTHSVAEHAFGLLFALRRNILRYHADVTAGAWQHATQFALHSHPLDDLNGSTLGIIGLGDIGHAVARIAGVIGMKVLEAERRGARQIRPDRVPFEQVLAESDAVSLHCPLTPETLNLIGEAELRQMKPGAILLNLARGGLVDEAALAQALREGRIAGAGVDVLTTEPPRDGNPLLEVAGPNCIVTPHIAWASRQAMARLAEEVTRNIEAFYRGEARNRVA